VTFSAARDAGGQGIYLASGGSISTLITTDDPLLAGFSSLYSTGINSVGTVVFAADAVDAQNSVTGTGIFASLPGAATFAVVRTGDSLFGSTVAELGFFGCAALPRRRAVATRATAGSQTLLNSCPSPVLPAGKSPPDYCRPRPDVDPCWLFTGGRG